MPRTVEVHPYGTQVLSALRLSKGQVSLDPRTEICLFPFAMGHYIENTGEEPLRFLEM